MESLAVELPREQQRVRDLLPLYDAIPTGVFAATLMRQALTRAEQAAATGDVIECNRKAFGFEIKKDFYAKAKAWIECNSSYLIHQIRPDRLRRLLHPAHLPSH
ncbi:MAG: hypothetical protein BWY57_03128 [Betaproteobacteria bacterium ADurb.Bin341]|nr:MAG: hypothetical protein BWY57_03128 [Betaproteobacteria bacterium ADurb.Bin341]